jgi:phosphoribosylformylglycinamidine cyclo-ligase
VAEEEMYRVFNMGIGMVLIVGADFKSVRSDLEAAGERVYEIGKVVGGKKGVRLI